MSLDYEHLFSQIDKAKKKRGNYWNTPAAKKLREQHEKDQADKKRRSDILLHIVRLEKNK